MSAQGPSDAALRASGPHDIRVRDLPGDRNAGIWEAVTGNRKRSEPARMARYAARHHRRVLAMTTVWS
jgi:hypothetical protein